MQPGDLLSHGEMCTREGKMLQQGMNFAATSRHSVLLMSQRPGAPYPDRLRDDGRLLCYVGHDAYGHPDKATIDQPLYSGSGSLTQNGRFFQAAADYRQRRLKHFVRVYEKLSPGVWVYNGLFLLTDARMESDGVRKICVLELTLQDDYEDNPTGDSVSISPGRMIPTEVKIKVLRRDGRKCVQCGATQNLHFDHILPYSEGGTSSNTDNIQLLCQKCNLSKSNRIV